MLGFKFNHVSKRVPCTINGTHMFRLHTPLHFESAHIRRLPTGMYIFIKQNRYNTMNKWLYSNVFFLLNSTPRGFYFQSPYFVVNNETYGIIVYAVYYNCPVKMIMSPILHACSILIRFSNEHHIIVVLHASHGGWNLQQPNCLFDRLFRLAIKKQPR